MEVQLLSFLTLALDGVEWSVAGACRFTAGERDLHFLKKRVLAEHQSRSGRLVERERNDDRGNSYRILAGKPDRAETFETMTS